MAKGIGNKDLGVMERETSSEMSAWRKECMRNLRQRWGQAHFLGVLGCWVGDRDGWVLGVKGFRQSRGF